MTTETFNSWKHEVIPLLYALLIMFFAATSVGRQAIVWLLMKLYEIFIQKNQ